VRATRRWVLIGVLVVFAVVFAMLAVSGALDFWIQDAVAD